MSWLPPVVTSLPAAEPISSAEAKLQCRVDGSDHDAEIDLLIQAARETAEGRTGLSLVTQTVVMRASSFDDLCRLPAAPVSAVSSITYLDLDGAEQTLSTSIYESVLIGKRPHVRLKVGQIWPVARDCSDAIRVTAVCGFGAASSVPVQIKQAMLLMIGGWFDSKAVGEVSPAVDALLARHRRPAIPKL
jgi:uncharacterized phiE125 gp8 family phage protein